MPSAAVLVDTGPLVSFYVEGDPKHHACEEAMRALPVGKAYTCWPVIAEVCYLLRSRPEQREHFLSSLSDGVLNVLSIGVHELGAVVDIFGKYHDQTIDLADACLLHLADREGIDEVLTLDHRHFSILRRLNGEVLRIIPESA